MRPRLLLRTDRRHGLAPRRTSGAPRPRGDEGARAVESPTRMTLVESSSGLRADLLAPDADFCRARLAGGPEDTAQYSCSCGYQFAADVSTSVACPHCGTAQAW